MYKLELVNDYNPSFTLKFETHKEFNISPSEDQIKEWIKDIEEEFNFHYDYYNVKKV
jgi:hypothetical protein